MGRRERPLDPAEGPIAQFAYELRKLRREAGGLTYRAMARAAHYSSTTLAEAAAGDRLPSLAVALAYARACGADDAALADWERRWHQAEREAARQVRENDDAKAPYLGLARFDTADRDRFFGRDLLAERLASLVREHDVVVLAGPSGSGKSSLLRAGLIPRLVEPSEPGPARPSAIRILVPGAHPARTHTAVLDPDRTADGTLVIVDQFEEVFTLCSDDRERAEFLSLLFALVEAGRSTSLVLAVRADFYGHCTLYPALAAAAQAATLLVPPMTPEELREAVVRPAALAGLTVERSLTARVVDEVKDEPGGLPLLSHALLETWHRRHGRALSESAYEAAGGIRGAIARTAEELYGALTPQQAQVARLLLLRLVTPGQGTPDTRRPTDRAELMALAARTPPHDDHADAALVLERLSRARLITLDGDTVDLAHEAVLTAWPRLRTWIDEDRERLRAQRHLTEAAHAWHGLGRDPGALYRGLRLATAEEHFAPDLPEPALELTPLERDFLGAGLAARHSERRHRKLRTTALSVLVVLSLVAAVVAWQQNRAGERRRAETEARRLAAVAESLRTSDPVTAMRLSVAAWRVADLPETRSALVGAMAQKERDVFTDPDGDPATLRHLSADGRTLISVGARHVTRWDVTTHRPTATLPGLGSRMPDAGFVRGDAGWLPVFDQDNGVGVRDLATGRQSTAPLTKADAGAEMGPSGRSLVTYEIVTEGGLRDTDYRIRMWDVASRRPLLEFRRGYRLPTADWDQMNWARLTALSQQLSVERRPTTTGFPDVIVAPGDRHLALCVPSERIELWSVPARRRLPAPWLPRATLQSCMQERLVFSADGAYLGLIGPEGFRAWHIATGRQLGPVAHERTLKTVELSADGTLLAASDGSEILVWRLAQPEFPVFRHRLSGETVRDIRIDTSTRTLRYLGGPEGSWGPSVHTLDLGRAVDAPPERRRADAVASTPDGSVLATAHVDVEQSRVRFTVLDGRTGARLAEPPPMACPVMEGSRFVVSCDPHMAFDAAGRRLAHGVSWSYEEHGGSGRLSVYDIPRRQVVSGVGPRDLRGQPFDGLSFGPGGRSLLLGGDLGLLVPALPDTPDRPVATRWWDLTRRKVVRTLPLGAGRPVLHPGGKLLVTLGGQAYGMPSGTPLPDSRSPGRAVALAFSPDGRLLAVGDGSGRVVLWDGRLTRRLGVLVGADTPTYEHVSALAFSQDSGTLAVAGDEGTLQLWDTASQQRIGSPLPAPGDTVRALAFDRDGSTLYAAGVHASLRRYAVAPERVARAVCERVGEGLSRRQWEAHAPGLPYRPTCG
ncbi:WD40 repeat protein/transcriptional regulator with XRE-family HTH domain [Streptomyces sp. SAI-170]|uniref:nSTAND1 domain-containing NTPase n=1 Tax=Streptomyces sp. SAI-170 TaxID=3377729 RepID=UPI003C7DFF4B